ncbi:Ig-like domain-containing protein [Methanobrevibacter sp.]|uniref:Ig-like domain-containing protein n=1 Tax=Methanobrevibacter sp. TaxID=66852 RepID=UPI003862D7C4
MKCNKKLLIVLMVFISFLAIGTVSASDSDNIADTMAVSADDEVQTVNLDDKNDINDVLSAEGDNADDVQVSVNVENTTYDEQVLVNVAVTDNTGTVDLSNSTVEILVDGEYMGDAPINPATGQSEVELALGKVEVGTHYAQATLVSGTNKIATAGAVFSVTKADPIVLLENITAIIGAGVKVPVNVTDRKGRNLSGDAMVTIFIDGNSISKYAKIINGSAEATFDMADIMGNMMGMMGGDWGAFGGNSSQNSTNSTKMEFNITQIKNMVNGTGNQSGGSGGYGPFASGSSAVKFNYFLPVRTYNVSATFLSNRNYNEAENTTDLTVVYNTDVVYVADIITPKNIGDETIVDIMALDKYGNLMPNIMVTVVLDDTKEINVTLNEYASAQVTFDNLVNGDHKMVVSSNATGNITNQTFDFNVVLPKIDVTITAEDMSVVTVRTSVDGKIGKNFTVTLKDSLGNVLNNKTVQLSINNKKYNFTTDENGTAKLQLNILKANVYTCAIAFLGDDAYNGAFDIAKVTVKKQTAKLTTKNVSYKAKAKTKKITATFKSAKGNAIKNKKITFKVKGKTYTAKTNSKGVATAKVKLTTKGKFTFTAKFAGDSTYKALSKKGKLTIK